MQNVSKCAGWRWTASGKNSGSQDASTCIFETNAKVSSGWPSPTLYTFEVQRVSFSDALGQPFTNSSLYAHLASSMFATVMQQPRLRASRCKLLRLPSPRWIEKTWNPQNTSEKRPVSGFSWMCVDRCKSTASKDCVGKSCARLQFGLTKQADPGLTAL